MKNYLELMRYVLENGDDRKDRTGVGIRSIFGYQMRFSLFPTFPLVTTKLCNFKAIVAELLWFLDGDTNANTLKNQGVNIWNEWADSNGELGPVYGKQWRAWGAGDNRKIDQISILLKNLKEIPYSRRHIVSAWNCGEIEKMALPPCHTMFQFYISKGKLSCQLYQRSCDVFLGLPFNIASYSLLTHMIAQQLDLGVGEFVWTGGDVHLYHNHFDQAKIQLEREPRDLPKLVINTRPKDLFSYKLNDFSLDGYNPLPRIAAPIAV